MVVRQQKGITISGTPPHGPTRDGTVTNCRQSAATEDRPENPGMKRAFRDYHRLRG
jgi:hypothetical protein